MCLRSWKLRTLSINNQFIKTSSSFNRIPDILADNMSRIKNPTIRMVSKRPFGQDFLTIGQTNDSRICIRPDSQNSQNSMNMEPHPKAKCTISIMKSNDSICFHTNLSHSKCTRAHKTIAIYLSNCTQSTTVATTDEVLRPTCSMSNSVASARQSSVLTKTQYYSIKSSSG